MRELVRWTGAVGYAKGAAKGLKDGADFLLEEANRGVPLEESTLEKSGKASVDAEKLVAAVSYDTPYARRQHEELTLRHAAGRRAKWLQLALTEQQEKINKLIAKGIIEGGL